MFRDDFNTFDESQWIRGFWWQDNRVPFDERIKREWFNSDNVTILNGYLLLLLRWQPKTFEYLKYLYDCLSVTTDPDKQQYLISLIAKYKNDPEITINVSSGVVCSKKLFSYGYYEARIFMQSEKTWNAFWLYGEGKDPTEIDIMEQLNGKLNEYSTNAHITYKTCFGRRKRKQHEQDIAQTIIGWHTYGLDLKKDKLIFYFDGNPVRVLSRHVSQITLPQRVIFNTACYPEYDTMMKIDYFVYNPSV